MKTLATIAAAAVLALGVAATASAAAPAPAFNPGPHVTKDGAVEQAGYYWRYRQFRRGHCFYRTFYISNGYRWVYRWRRVCY
jgi:hypothetical protein